MGFDNTPTVNTDVLKDYEAAEATHDPRDINRDGMYSDREQIVNMMKNAQLNGSVSEAIADEWGSEVANLINHGLCHDDIGKKLMQMKLDNAYDESNLYHKDPETFIANKLNALNEFSAKNGLPSEEMAAARQVYDAHLRAEIDTLNKTLPAGIDRQKIGLVCETVGTLSAPNFDTPPPENDHSKERL